MNEKSLYILELAEESYLFSDYQKCYEYSVEAIKEDSNNYKAWGYKALAASKLSTLYKSNFHESFSSTERVYSKITDNSDYFPLFNTNHIIVTPFIVNIASSIEDRIEQIVLENFHSKDINAPVISKYYWFVNNSLAYIIELKRFAHSKSDLYLITESMIRLFDFIKNFETDELVNNLDTFDKVERNMIIKESNKAREDFDRLGEEVRSNPFEYMCCFLV